MQRETDCDSVNYIHIHVVQTLHSTPTIWTLINAIILGPTRPAGPRIAGSAGQ